ncbi:AI-2E family transporter [Roseibium aggregatum]|uniref:AI-2E family transporter n=1 Tax=Roseibium aggregatum TaxID=187304 RepID=A0A939J0J2_9HYPH|nr:AI-2E family transporter [Roseibium aggregatum]MBN9669343.1 AI-2E family transporter [Roseibium aggregatum]
MADEISNRPSGNGPGKPDPTLDARVIDIAIRLGVLGLFAFFSLQLIAPFFVFLLWAVVLTAALCPAYAWLAGKLGGRKVLSAVLITLLCLAIVIGPVAVLIASLVETLHDWYLTLADGAFEPPVLPVWIADLPVIGSKIAAFWQEAGRNLEALIAKLGPKLVPAGGKVLSLLASLSGSVLFFIVSIVIAGCLFVPGPALAKGAKRFADRIIAPRGAEFVDLAGATIRNVSRGVIGVAIIQGLLTGILLIVFAVPFAGVLTFAALILCIVQIGPALVIVPTIIWAWTSWEFAPALLFTVLMVPVMLVDNVLRPILMSRGLDVPMLVILIGVLGGTIAYGLIGLFLGPVVLAVFYELVTAWVKAGEEE